MKASSSDNNINNNMAIVKPLTTMDPYYFADKIKIPRSKGLLLYHKKDILYLKAESNYCTIHFANGEKKLFSKTLKELFSYLPFGSFIKVHQSFVVNKCSIKSLIIETGNAYVLLNDHLKIPVSRSFKKLFSVNYFNV